MKCGYDYGKKEGVGRYYGKELGRLERCVCRRLDGRVTKRKSWEEAANCPVQFART